MLTIARSLGMLASLLTLLLWIALSFFNPYGYQGLTDESRLISVVMILLAIVGVFAVVKIKPYLMLGVGILSFVPVGFYLLGTPSLFKWIGVSNAMFVLSSLLMLMALRLPSRHKSL